MSRRDAIKEYINIFLRSGCNIPYKHIFYERLDHESILLRSGRAVAHARRPKGPAPQGPLMDRITIHACDSNRSYPGTGES